LTYILATDIIGLCLLLFMQLSLEVEPSESKTASTKTRVLHDIATQGHSSSFILQSITGRRGVAYRRIILLAGFLRSTTKSPKIAVVDNPTLI